MFKKIEFKLDLHLSLHFHPLQSVFRDYLGHFIGSPHSLLVKILGDYSIQIGKQKKLTSSKNDMTAFLSYLPCSCIVTR